MNHASIMIHDLELAELGGSDPDRNLIAGTLGCGMNHCEHV
jgi:hypothetical protein